MILLVVGFIIPSYPNVFSSALLVSDMNALRHRLASHLFTASSYSISFLTAALQCVRRRPAQPELALVIEHEQILSLRYTG
jgi:hypothetical protein